MTACARVHSTVSRSLALAAAAALAPTCDAKCEAPAVPDARSSAWSLGPALPRRALEPGVAALGQSVVVAGGFASSASEGLEITARVDALDPGTGAWTALPDAPVRWTHVNLAAVGATLYIAGGLDGPGLVARGDAFALDPIDHGWHAIPALPPGEERGAAGVISAPGRIYLLGGASSTAALASCLVYDIATRRWSRLPDLPAPRSHLAAMRRSDGWLIAAGGLAGLDGSAPRGEVWALPPLAAAWQPLAALRAPGAPDTRGGCAYGAVLGQLVCAGGEAGQSARGAVDSFDPYTDVWTAREAMPVARAGTPGAAIGGRLFVPGGAADLTGDPIPTDTLYIYAPLDTAPR